MESSARSGLTGIELLSFFTFSLIKPVILTCLSGSDKIGQKRLFCSEFRRTRATCPGLWKSRRTGRRFTSKAKDMDAGASIPFAWESLYRPAQ